MINDHSKKRINKPFADVLGMGSALLCLIHCLAAPFLMGFGVHIHPEDSGFIFHEFWELLFLALGFIAVYFSSKHSRYLAIKVLLWTTYLSLVCSIILHYSSPLFEYFIYGASLILIIAHSVNLRTLLQKKVV